MNALYDLPMGDLAKQIKQIRLALGLDQTQFAELLDTSQATVSRWEKGSIPGGENLKRIADLGRTTVEKLFGLDEAPLIPSDDIPIVGYVGGGAEVFPVDDYARGDGMGTVERPPFVQGSAVAVEVRGDSMFPIAENGWKIIYTGDQTILESEVLNKLCVVKLADGRMMVKRLIRGSSAGRYHLMSTNAPLIEDVEVEWAARVKAIVPT